MAKCLQVLKVIESIQKMIIKEAGGYAVRKIQFIQRLLIYWNLKNTGIFQRRSKNLRQKI